MRSGPVGYQNGKPSPGTNVFPAEAFRLQLGRSKRKKLFFLHSSPYDQLTQLHQLHHLHHPTQVISYITTRLSSPVNPPIPSLRPLTSLARSTASRQHLDARTSFAFRHQLNPLSNTPNSEVMSFGGGYGGGRSRGGYGDSNGYSNGYVLFSFCR
jgi:hypothetical protein